jgi:hypothetical protein
MSYETRVEEMVGKHVATFQQELSAANGMRGCTRKHCPMPYGYPLAVWCPRHVCLSPRVRPASFRGGGCLSNGVPPLLRLRLVGGYVLGLYNPEH